MSEHRNVVVSYGGGVNSVALLVWLVQNGHAPNVLAITMADPGSERAATYRYVWETMAAWCPANGLPPITVVRRTEEGQHRPRAWRLETLEEECLRMGNLPSVAYGFKKCSAKYKAEPQRWWLERQSWAIALWARGEKITRTIGYDADETRRVEKALRTEWRSARETERFGYWYPLHAAGLDREGCEALIKSAGLPPVGKSACTFCPNNTLSEWEELRRDEPAAFARAVVMSRSATVEAPDVVGLMRCNPHGKRQLHVWAEGGYDGCGKLGGREDEQPCECAL